MSESEPAIPPENGFGTIDDSRVVVLQLRAPLPAEVDQPGLLDWVNRLVAELSPASTSLTIRVTHSAEVRLLNDRFRDQSKPTDVLSFPGDATLDGSHLGDIVIAIQVAAEQAQHAGYSLLKELQTLILHAVLHCMGYDHETDEGEMEQLENELRQRWLERC